VRQRQRGLLSLLAVLPRRPRLTLAAAADWLLQLLLAQHASCMSAASLALEVTSGLLLETTLLLSALLTGKTGSQLLAAELLLLHEWACSAAQSVLSPCCCCCSSGPARRLVAVSGLAGLQLACALPTESGDDTCKPGRTATVTEWCNP
jgi:hypothetical protein